MQALRRPKTVTLMTFILGITITCFLIPSFHGVITWFTSEEYSQKSLDITVSYFDRKIAPNTKQPMNISEVSPLVKKVLDRMKLEINDPTLTAESMFPATLMGHLILDPNLCKRSSHIDIIIIVHTAPTNFAKRQRIRESFADTLLFHPFQVRVAFLLGKTSNQTLERIVWLEHITHNDTVIGDFYDHYHNLSLKGVMGFRWVSEHCSNSDFVLKIDDDVLVNMFKLLNSYLPHMLGKKKTIFCNVWHKGTMPILRNGKWKVESHIFSSRRTFPYDYCSGFVVIITTDLMESMYKAALITPFFWIDDVYLFGMLPAVIGDVTYYNYGLNKNLTLNCMAAVNCILSQGTKCPIFATHIPNMVYTFYWNLIKNVYNSTSTSVGTKVYGL